MAAPRFPSEFLTPQQLEKIQQEILEAARAGRDNEAWQGVQTLLPAAQRQEFVAAAVVYLVGQGHFSVEQSLELLAAVYEVHKQSATVLALMGGALESARDINFLNAAPPEHPLFLNVVTALAELAQLARGETTEIELLEGLATAARMVGRQRDELVEMACKRLIELEPKKDAHYYNYGLFLKTRGRFQEGMQANQKAESLLLLRRPKEYEWNLGICATGAGEADAALAVWKRLKNEIEIGRFGLPDGNYPDVKVRLAQRPLAERTADSDDPGIEETIWVERLSPCHGIVRSVLVNDLGVDLGDVVLFDGAPVTEQIYGDQKVPVFPHLATLRRGCRRLVSPTRNESRLYPKN
jgi:tetratricopeptide (TPR) repeat protein